MKKILNPYTKLEGYHCFGCSPRNAAGLKMTFSENDDEIISEWLPVENYEGYSNVVHGGIQATLLDETGSWTVLVKLHTAGVTSSMNIKYHHPVSSRDGILTLRARIAEKRRNLAVVKAELYDSNGLMCTSAEIIYYTFKPDEARNKFNYPGDDAFYESQP